MRSSVYSLYLFSQPARMPSLLLHNITLHVMTLYLQREKKSILQRYFISTVYANARYTCYNLSSYLFSCFALRLNLPRVLLPPRSASTYGSTVHAVCKHRNNYCTQPWHDKDIIGRPNHHISYFIVVICVYTNIFMHFAAGGAVAVRARINELWTSCNRGNLYTDKRNYSYI